MINHSTTTHVFTESGNGLAPFTFHGVTEMAYCPTPEINMAGGSCQHCGTGIRWAYHLKSTDGKAFYVGSDCIMKSGDAGLIDIAKAERNRRAREKAQAKRALKREADLQRQRDANGGLTNWEARQAKLDKARTVAQEKAAVRMQLLAPLADSIADGRYGFCDSVADTLRAGTVPRGRGFTLVCEILGKKAGRKNTDAYKAEFNRIEVILNQANGS